MATSTRGPDPAPVVDDRDSSPPRRKAQKPREVTARRRREILDAAMETFGAKGYHNGSLVEVAQKVGITHSGVLHHFGSKDRLLTAVLDHRDATDVEGLENHEPPKGMGLFPHLVHTSEVNATRPGIVQTYAVLSAESVTEDHPAQEYFRHRFAELRDMVGSALAEVCEPEHMPAPEQISDAAASILAVMDGLQVQWLLDPDNVDLARATAFTIDAVLAKLLHDHERVRVPEWAAAGAGGPTGQEG